MPGPGTGSPPPPCGVMMPLLIVHVVILIVFGCVFVCSVMIAGVAKAMRRIATVRARRECFVFNLVHLLSFFVEEQLFV
jgi:hypothetical protein